MLNAKVMQAKGTRREHAFCAKRKKKQTAKILHCQVRHFSTQVRSYQSVTILLIEVKGMKTALKILKK